MQRTGTKRSKNNNWYGCSHGEEAFSKTTEELQETGTLYDPSVMGRVIAEQRRKRGWSQEVLSGFADISRSHLAMIENGSISAGVCTLWKIASALDMKFSELLVLVEKNA